MGISAISVGWWVGSEEINGVCWESSLCLRIAVVRTGESPGTARPREGWEWERLRVQRRGQLALGLPESFSEFGGERGQWS
jgi:hypothetical protein